MTNYSVTDWDSGRQVSVAGAIAAMETYLETVTDSKTIRAWGLVPVNNGKYFVAWVVHDA